MRTVPLRTRTQNRRLLQCLVCKVIVMIENTKKTKQEQKKKKSAREIRMSLSWRLPCFRILPAAPRRFEIESVVPASTSQKQIKTKNLKNYFLVDQAETKRDEERPMSQRREQKNNQTPRIKTKKGITQKKLFLQFFATFVNQLKGTNGTFFRSSSFVRCLPVLCCVFYFFSNFFFLFFGCFFFLLSFWWVLFAELAGVTRREKTQKLRIRPSNSH